MERSLYIDIHTHQAPESADTLAVLNIDGSELQDSEYTYLSAGIHPWNIPINRNEQLGFIEDALVHKKIAALGECGLDRKCKTPFALQEKVFIEQAQMAAKYNKPLIIHCVRAYNEIISIRKELNATNPWIIHGFRANLQTAHELIRHKIYLSFGKALFSDTRLRQVFIDLMPFDFFLETDDAHFPVETLYHEVSQLYQVELPALKRKCLFLFQNVFSLQKI